MSKFSYIEVYFVLLRSCLLCVYLTAWWRCCKWPKTCWLCCSKWTVAL